MQGRELCSEGSGPGGLRKHSCAHSSQTTFFFFSFRLQLFPHNLTVLSKASWALLFFPPGVRVFQKDIKPRGTLESC